MSSQVRTFLLSVAFVSYVLLKLQVELPTSAVQAFGIAALGILALSKWWIVPREMLVLVGLGVIVIGTGWLFSEGGDGNALNSLLVFLSFPVAMAASIGVSDTRLFRNVMMVILIVCIIGFVQGNVSVSYSGDIREERWVLGFQRPTFLSEAMTLLVVAAVGYPWKDKSGRLLMIILVLAAVVVLIRTGSRAGLGASLIFLFLIAMGGFSTEWRKIITLGVAVICLAGLSMSFWRYLDYDAIDALSTGRWGIFLMEYGGNIVDFSHVLFGNNAAATVFEYSADRDGFVYHLDSFFGERLITTGLLGLVTVVLQVWVYSKHCLPHGRAIIAACVFYGVFENSVFNLTSMFSTYMLLFSALWLRSRPGSRVR